LVLANVYAVHVNAQNTAVFPGAVPDHEDLVVAVNLASTTLTTTLAAGGTTFTVASASAFFDPGVDEAGIVVIGTGSSTEIIKYCGLSGNTFTVCSGGRGFDGTSDIRHAAGQTVADRIVAHHYNQLAAEVIAIATVVDAGGGGGGGGAPASATYITQTPNASLSAEQALSLLATGIVKNTTTTGVLSIAVDGDFPSTLARDSETTAAIAAHTADANAHHTPTVDTDTHVAIEEGNVSVIADPTALDFGPGFDLTEAAGEVEIVLDYTEDPVNLASGEVTGVLPDANVANDITLTNITQITNRAVSDTTGDLALGSRTSGDYVGGVADGTGIDGTASGEGSTYTPTLDLTELGDTTFGGGSEAALDLIFDPSGATQNPIIRASDSTLNFVVTNLQQNGTAVSLGAHTTDTDTHVAIEENNSSVIADPATLDFLGADFDLSEAGGEVEISIAAAIARDSELAAYLPLAGGVMTGTLDIDNNQRLRLYEPDANGTNYLEHIHGNVNRTTDIQISWENINGPCGGANGGVLTLNGSAPTLTVDCEDDDGGAGGFVSFNIDGDDNDPQTITDGNEALFAGGVGIDTAASATDTITFTLDLTELDALTISDGGETSVTITGNVSGTDAVITLGDGVVNVSTGTLQQGGTAVSLSGHTHTGSTLSGIDISGDTNLAVTAPIVLTDDTLSLNLTSLTLTTPLLSGKVDGDAGAVNDDDCTGEQGFIWYDDTDSRWEACNADSGTPVALDGSAVVDEAGNYDWTGNHTWTEPLRVGDHATGLTFIDGLFAGTPQVETLFAKTFASGGDAAAPNMALAFWNVADEATSLANIGLFGGAQASINSADVWAANFVAVAEAGITTPTLVGLEIDVLPDAGQATSTDSHGLSIVGFNRAIAGPAIFITGNGSGTWAGGIDINGIASAGSGIYAGGAFSADSFMNTANGTYATDAVIVGNDTGITFQATTGSNGRIFANSSDAMIFRSPNGNLFAWQNPGASANWALLNSSNLQLLTGIDLLMYDTDGSNYISLEAPALAANFSVTLPGSAGTLALVGQSAASFFGSGELEVVRGGTGAATLTGALQGNGTSAVTGVTTFVRSVWFGAGALSVDGTQCADPAEVTIGSWGKQFAIICADNDASTITGSIQMPDGWNGGTVTFEAAYIQDAADTSALNSDIAARCVGAAETPLSYGTEVAIDDAGVTGTDAIDNTTSGAVTPAGTCAAGDYLQFQWQLDATGTTTAAATLNILGFKMEYTVGYTGDN